MFDEAPISPFNVVVLMFNGVPTPLSDVLPFRFWCYCCDSLNAPPPFSGHCYCFFDATPLSS